MPVRYNLTNILFPAFLLVCLLSFFPAAAQGDFAHIQTVVIDAGHGGKDCGTRSLNRKFMEKDITLSVALRLGRLIRENCPDVKVIYTRTTDVYVTLSERAAIANRNHADLFISVHVNATTGSTQPRGTETFVMGTHKSEANFEVCKKENSVIVIEDDYQTKYAGFDPNSPESYIIFSLLQNTHQQQSIKFAAHIQKQFAKGPVYVNRGVKQGGLLVLWQTTMPAVLTEIGFITNPKDYAVITTKDGQARIARRLFDAFLAYRNEFEAGKAGSGSVSVPAAAPAPQRPSVAVSQQQRSSGAAPSGSGSVKGNDFYAIQIHAVPKSLKPGCADFKGRKDVKYVKVGTLYKYYVGRYASRKEAAQALGALRKKFPGAFVIHISNNTIVK